MHLSAHILENVANVNNYDVVNQATLFEGQANSLYFQIVNKSKDEIRYLSQTTSLAVSLVFPSIDDAEEFEVAAAMPFSDDKSIWKVDLSSSQLPASGAFFLKIIENGVERQFRIEQSLVVELLNNGGC